MDRSVLQTCGARCAGQEMINEIPGAGVVHRYPWNILSIVACREEELQKRVVLIFCALIAYFLLPPLAQVM